MFVLLEKYTTCVSEMLRVLRKNRHQYQVEHVAEME